MSDQQPTQRRGMPWYFWAVVVLGVLWNGLGVVLWAGTSFAPDQFLKDLPPAHRDYVSSLPSWSTATWGLGVVGGLVGVILLSLRGRLSVPVLAASLFGAVANTMIYVVYPAPPGFFNVPLTVFIIGFATFLVFFARAMQRRDTV